MQYTKVTFTTVSQNSSDMLMAMLADIGYNGFEEAESKLLAYIEAPKFLAAETDDIAATIGTTYETELIPEQNWNALWESNFEPVIVDDFCTIRAHFHDIVVTTPYDIVITPKMSFGTGHHATTQLMMLGMRQLDIKGKSVFDFGTGTGVLAILAEMLGAANIVAIDNEEWAVENAKENVLRNNCTHAEILAGSLEDAPETKTDIILANINRHILLQYMKPLYDRLENDGIILMSGLLVADKEIIVDSATSAGFNFVRVSEQNNWIAILCIKPKL